MKIIVCSLVIVVNVLICRFGYASPMDWLKGSLKTATTTSLSDTKIGSGLKEALKVGIENTIKLLGKRDGYLTNPSAKILLPDSIKKLESTLRSIGFGAQLDEFTLSMNRAAEKAAPGAAEIFSSAITSMSIEDVQKLYQGGNTAATDYLKLKTSAKLLEQFKPVVSKAMDEYAVTKKSQEIMGKAKALPLVGKYVNGFDINSYVSSKALEGLFKVLALEETKIRTNPASRVTSLLKEVFKSN